jgi:hypothetical protein
MVIQTRQAQVSGIGQFNSRNRFVPPTVSKEVLSNCVKADILLRKRTKDGDRDPRQRDTSGPANAVRNQYLFDLVGIHLKVNGEWLRLPDPSGVSKLPPLGTPEYRVLMNTGTGIYVESLYADGLETLRQAIVDGDIPFSLEEFDKLLEGGNLNAIMSTQGATLRALGLMRREEMLVRDILFGSKTLSVTMLKTEVADRFSEEFISISEEVNFQNVAFTVALHNLLTVTELSPRGIVTPTFSGEVHMKWTPDGKIDRTSAYSGAAYSFAATNSKNVGEVSVRASAANALGQSQSIDRRRSGRVLGEQRAFGADIGQEIATPMMPL